jgi:type IV pilus assembly protein PilP
LSTSLRKIIRILGVAAFGALGLTLSACSYDSADLRDYVAEVKSRPGGELDKPPEFPRFEAIPEISQEADPFKSFLADELAKTAKRPEHPPWPPRNEEELERYALDSLRMVGTLEQKDEQWGLVRDPGGVIHRVKAGNFMGENFGKIIEVSEQRIHLLEKVSDGEGDWEDRTAKISLSE